MTDTFIEFHIAGTVCGWEKIAFQSAFFRFVITAMSGRSTDTRKNSPRITEVTVPKTRRRLYVFDFIFYLRRYFI
ncbi:MAG: hypothetical protein V8S82_00310 [Eubacteriales bacterium]